MIKKGKPVAIRSNTVGENLLMLLNGNGQKCRLWLLLSGSAVFVLGYVQRNGSVLKPFGSVGGRHLGV